MNQPVQRNPIAIYGFLLLLVLPMWSCDSGFDPILDDHNQNYSIYGTLDLHADTQWVRVMPISQQLIPTDTTNATSVYLTNESTGERIAMNDSLFRFSNNAHVWNYWTTYSLDPHTQYTLEAVHKSGQTASVQVEMPAPFPPPVVDFDDNRLSGFIWGSSQDSIVVAQARFTVRIPSSAGLGPPVNLEISILDRVIQNSQGEFRFLLDAQTLMADELDVSGSVVWVDRSLIMVSGSKDWPQYNLLSEEELSIPGLVSNVENGVGYLAAGAVREVPLYSCYNAQGDRVPCTY
jgi:hypothetical protein